MEYQEISIIEAIALIVDHRADKAIDSDGAILKLFKEGFVLLDSGAKIFTEVGFNARSRGRIDIYDKYVRKYVIH